MSLKKQIQLYMSFFYLSRRYLYFVNFTKGIKTLNIITNTLIMQLNKTKNFYLSLFIET